MSRPQGAVIIGAGIIGLNVGLRLLHDGLKVHFIDPQSPGGGASFGNAGVIGVGAAIPVGLPSVLASAPNFLFKQEGTAIIRPGYLPKALPWLARFVRACRPGQVEEISRALYSISSHALVAYEALFSNVGIADDIRRTGALTVYRTRASFESAAAAIALRQRRGAAVEMLSEKETLELEPSLARGIYRSLYFPDYASLDNPAALCKRLADRARALGAVFQSAIVTGVAVVDGKATMLELDDGDSIKLGNSIVVVAAGAHSRKLARDVGCGIALDTERGYHAEIEDPGFELRRPVLISEAGCYASTMGGRLRLAGTVELAGLERAPDWKRADRMVDAAKGTFPSLRASTWTRWMGFRPSMPNSLPIIGRSPLVANAYIACGHGHLGMTLGAITGALIGDLISDRTIDIDMRPFSPRPGRSFNLLNSRRTLSHGTRASTRHSSTSKSRA